jgi:hypothetical protein
MGADATIPPKGGLPFADPLQPAESGGGSIPPMQCPTHAKTEDQGPRQKWRYVSVPTASSRPFERDCARFNVMDSALCV